MTAQVACYQPNLQAGLTEFDSQHMLNKDLSNATVQHVSSHPSRSTLLQLPYGWKKRGVLPESLLVRHIDRPSRDYGRDE